MTEEFPQSQVLLFAVTKCLFVVVWGLHVVLLCVFEVIFRDQWLFCISLWWFCVTVWSFCVSVFSLQVFVVVFHLFVVVSSILVISLL